MNILFSFSTENSFVVLLAFTDMPWVEKVDVQELHCWCKKKLKALKAIVESSVEQALTICYLR